MNNNSTINSEITFNELLKRFISYSISNNLREGTIKIYRTVGKYFIENIGDKNITEFTPIELEDYKSKRANKVEKATINKEIRSIKAIFNYAVNMELIQRNPFAKVKQIKTDDGEILSMSNLEVSMLFKVIPEGYFRNLVKFALLTGCRLSEIIYIQWNDIDFTRELIYVRNKAQFKTKTGKNREIPINDCLRALLSLIRACNSEVLKVEDYIFCKKNGDPYNKNFISRKFKSFVMKSGIDNKFHFHCLRHTLLTNLANFGTPINSLKKLAGHSNIKTTELYLHSNLEQERAYLKKISC